MAPLDDKENNPVRLWAEIHKLRSEARGPEKFETSRDAAIHERMRAVKAETESDQRYAGWFRDQIEATANGAKPALLPAGYAMVSGGAIQSAVNMLRRDGEEGYKVRGELAEELARSII